MLHLLHDVFKPQLVELHKMQQQLFWAGFELWKLLELLRLLCQNSKVELQASPVASAFCKRDIDALFTLLSDIVSAMIDLELNG